MKPGGGVFVWTMVNEMRKTRRHGSRLLRLMAAGSVVWLLLGSWMAAVSLGRPYRARGAMVVSAHRLASEAGVEILRRGGNAVDAAVATAFALAVVYPAAGNLGGGGFMVIRWPDGRATTIDFREKAPAAAHRDMFVDSTGQVRTEASRTGYLASGVPGTVAGLCYALHRYGTLPLREVLKPAIRLAERGFVVDYWLAQDLAQHADGFRRFPGAAAVFLKNRSDPYTEGDWLVQRDLARTLRLIAREGPNAFYRGEIGRRLIEDFRRNGGLITADDLAAYEPVEREPVVSEYRGYRIIGMGPPSSGGVLLAEMLNVLEGFSLSDLGHHSAQYLHLLAEVMRRAFYDRARYLGDADFVPVPLARLLSKAYAESLRAGISWFTATRSEELGDGGRPRVEGSQTTHFSVVDAHRLAVAVTTTLNGSFGSYVVVPGTGFLMNNEMDDFSLRAGVPNMFGLVQSEANAIAPGKRMLSSMCPTIVEREGKLWLVVGSPGGPRIISTVLQVVLNLVDFGMDIEEAVSAPRCHHQWLPDVLYYEPRLLPTEVRDRLLAMGHRLQGTDRIGQVHAILVDPTDGGLWGGVDPRGSGAAVGY
ncbi:MAG: gamma-glutamyltransferase [candidate division KSB1 bacterium]|nr:gamma-glutamyltransferase [candidate division KSB1 bacterium]